MIAPIDGIKFQHAARYGDVRVVILLWSQPENRVVAARERSLPGRVLAQ